ncbi:hypothetical protein PtB15_6B444 [Puccinia triticina]|nr:hypothetical protein PtB15_6B444 [Puccinia triticina]
MNLVYLLPYFILLGHPFHHRASATPLLKSTASIERERKLGAAGASAPGFLQGKLGFSQPASVESERNLGEIGIKPDSSSPRHAPVDDDSYWQLSDEQGGVSVGKSGMLSQLLHVFKKPEKGGYERLSKEPERYPSNLDSNYESSPRHTPGDDDSYWELPDEQGGVSSENGGYERLSKEPQLPPYLESILTSEDKENQLEVFLTGRILDDNEAKYLQAQARKINSIEKLFQRFANVVGGRVANWDVKEQPAIEEPAEALRTNGILNTNPLRFFFAQTPGQSARPKQPSPIQDTASERYKTKLLFLDVFSEVCFLTGNDDDDLAKMVIYVKAIADVTVVKASDTEWIKEMKARNQKHLKDMWPMLGYQPKSDQAKLLLRALRNLCSFPENLQLGI